MEIAGGGQLLHRVPADMRMPMAQLLDERVDLPAAA
jgi:hypothetical protein